MAHNTSWIPGRWPMALGTLNCRPYAAICAHACSESHLGSCQAMASASKVRYCQTFIPAFFGVLSDFHTPGANCMGCVVMQPWPSTVAKVSIHLQGIHTKCFGAICKCVVYLTAYHHPIPGLNEVRMPPDSGASQSRHERIWQHKDNNSASQ